MPKRFDWDAVARSQRAQRHGTEYGYDELPPAGSYADRARYLSGDDSENAQTRQLATQAKPQQRKKTKPTRDERLRNLFRTLQALVAIPGGAKWKMNGLEYQQGLLAQLQGTLNAMLRLDSSKSSDPISIDVRRILIEHGPAAK